MNPFVIEFQDKFRNKYRVVVITPEPKGSDDIDKVYLESCVGKDALGSETWVRGDVDREIFNMVMLAVRDRYGECDDE